MSTPTPSIGRIVHYQTLGTPGGEHPSETVAAIITRVGGPAHTAADYVDLCVFYPNGWSNKTAIRRADEPTPGCWNW
ncbi:hypothetical protein, partial [Nocardia brasiliensis]|uniref:hypothetical protein n=1 Tax=Nocardia brasiliensis TaxID=37326 RepID=UPI0024552DA8